MDNGKKKRRKIETQRWTEKKSKSHLILTGLS